MVIIGMMCAKNEARWISRVLSAQHFCQRILLMDDHSTDDTVEIAQSFNNVTVLPSPFDDYQEGRNNEWIVQRVAQFDPDWVVHCMGDEVLESDTWDKIQMLLHEDWRTVIRFDVVNYWDGERVRIDRQWAKRKAHPIWRYPRNAKRLTYYPMHCGLPEQVECNMKPHPDQAQEIDVKLFHYGYSSSALRREAYDFFIERDPGRAEEYKHLLDEEPVAVLRNL